MSQPSQSSQSSRTVVHLVRHGEVHNPEGVLYGRRDGFHLSDLGHRMAERVAGVLGERDVVHVVSSPLERAQETAAPTARALGLQIATDPRLIESSSKFEGRRFGGERNPLLDPRLWRHLWNPLRPSWGEPFKDIAARMHDAVHDARARAEGHEAVVVSHQLPIWTTRLRLEGRSFLHDPRKRECSLCSITSLHFEGERVVRIAFSEPAGDLIPAHQAGKPFSSGGAPQRGRS